MSSARRKIRLLAASLLAAISCAALAATAAPPVAAPATPQEIQFRRVYAPADRAADWPTGKTPFVPVDAKEVERLLDAAQASVTGAPASDAPLVNTARYEARLEGDDLLLGRASLEVTHRAKASAILPLTACSVAIENPTWIEKEPAKAIVGNGADGRLGVLVDSSGQLRFDWSLRGERNASGAVSFRWEMVACPASRLTLDLPQRMLIFASQGLVTLASGAPEGQRRWTIDFGGHERVVLRIATEEAAREQRQLTLLRQSLTYEFSPRGVDVVAQLKIDVHNEPLQRVVVDLGPELRLVSARFADADIPWSATAGENQHSKVVLEFPSPLLGSGGVLRLTALAPLVSGQRWRLPGIRPEGLFWQEGTATLLLPAPLVLEQLALEGCRQSKTGPLPGPLSGDSVELQYYTPDAGIDVVVGRPQGRIKLDSGTQLELGPVEITGVQVVELSVKEGEHFQLQAAVPPQWQIDSVEAARPENISDWHVVGEDKSTQQLAIRLGRALSAHNPLRLVVRGHRPFNLSEMLDAQDLQLIQFRGVSAGRQLIALRATDGFEVNLTGGEQLNRLDALRITAADSRLFSAAPAGLLAAIDSGFASLKVTLEARRPSFSAEIVADVAVKGTSVAETTVLRVNPLAARLEKLLVHFSHPSPIRWQWTLVGGTAAQLSANRWTAAEQATAGLSTTGETWEINLRVPRSEPFEIKAVRTRTFNGRQPVVLASLAEASAQQGLVTIRALGDTGLLITNRRLKAVRSQPATAENYQTTRGSYRFEPSRDAMESEPIVSISPAPASQPESGALAWSYKLESHFALVNTAVHVATYHIQTTGRQQIRIAMPTGSQLRNAWIDNTPVARAAIDAAEGELTLDLPTGRRFATVRVHFLTSESLPRFAALLRPPLPQVDIPVMDGHWNIYLPAGYEIPEADLRWQAQPVPALTWSQRLFGPLGRSSKGQFFQPLSRDSWATLTAGSAETPSTLPPLASGEKSGEKSAEALPWSDLVGDGAAQFDTIWPANSWRGNYDLDLSTTGDLSIRIVHTWAMRVFGWGVFLILVAVIAWVGADHLLGCIVAAASLGALALLAPAAYTPAVTPAFMAVLFCLLVFCAGQRLYLVLPQGGRKRRSWRPAPAVQASAVLLFGALLLGSEAATAAQPAAADAPVASQTTQSDANAAAVAEPATPTATAAVPTPAPAVPAVTHQRAETIKPPATIHKIIVPTDAAQRPTGSKYFVPESLYNDLLRRAAAVTEQPGGWILHNAHYRGTLVREGVQKKLLVSDLKAAYDLQVFRSNVVVRIPLSHDGLVLPADGAKLDGQPIETKWDAAGGWLAVQINEPGAYRLELALQPSLQSYGTASGFDVGIPTLATSTLDLTVPPDTAAIELPGQRGRLKWDKQRGQIMATLGPTGRLSVRWPEAAGQDGMAPNLDVDELLWIKVRPGSMIVDARFRFRVIEGRVRQLRLLADPRLRLLPSTMVDSPIVGVHSTPGNPETIDLDLARPVSDQVTVDLTFLLTGVSGVGNLRLPRLEAAGARVAKRWLAVSVDPALQSKKKEGQDLPAVSVPDFTAAWGPAESTPQEAFVISRGEPNWVLATQPAEAQNSVDQSLAISFGQSQTRLKFDAMLSTAVSYNFQIRLVAPPDLQVDSLSVLEDGVQRVARWSKDEAGVVTAFLSSAATGRQQISLTGSLQAPPSGVLPLPKIEVADAKVTRSQIQVFRQPTMLVEVEPSLGVIVEQAPALDKSKLELGSLVGSYVLESPQATLVFKLAPNLPDTRLVEVIAVESDNDVWTAEVDCQLQVRGGLVDMLRLSIPAQWTGPFQLSQPATSEIVTIPGDSRRQLIVRPTAPIKDNYRIAIRSPLTMSAGDRLRVPDVVPLGMSHLQRFVVLPTQLELQRVVWSLSGLRPATLPIAASNQRAAPAAESVATFQVQSDRFEALLKSIERSSGVAHVRLADVAVAWSADGHYQGVVGFDLEPSGTTDCILQAPAGVQLLQVSVAGLPTHLVSAGDNRWRLSLGSPQLPQRINVVFKGTLAEGGWDSGWCRFDVPSLVGPEIERTLWTIYGPPQAGLGHPTQARAETSSAFHELARYRSLVGTLDLPADVAAEQSPEEMQRWYRVWRTRCNESRAALQAVLRQAVTRGTPSEAEADTLAVDEELKRIAARLGTAVANEAGAGGSDGDSPAQLLAAAQRGSQPTLCALRGAARSLTIRYPSLRTGDVVERLGWLFGLGLVTVTSVFLLERRAMRAFAPAQIGFVAGIFWWLLLAPSWAGLLLTIACGAFLLRQHWLRRTGRGSPRQQTA